MGGSRLMMKERERGEREVGWFGLGKEDGPAKNMGRTEMKGEGEENEKEKERSELVRIGEGKRGGRSWVGLG